MFFIFSYDLLLWLLLIGVFLIMLITFPVATILITGLFIWGVASLIKRGRQERAYE